ncbi:MAG: 16S rRNA (guanine(527)-N(7))-methyltransferase RsmG [Clostridia bacterium]|nr:16S rRNA (guanine(527)-N(7))-methyltransferase RsmG [Clostridia bacterium]
MIEFPFEEIIPLCAAFGTVLDDTAVDRLQRYGNLLLAWNEKMNLTAITEPREVLFKHFYDCLLLLKHTALTPNSRVIDVGTGAGFPGMVLKIVRPDLQVTLLDGLNKRLIFLNAVLEDIGLTAETIHLRAEEAGRDSRYREQFDLATARAVARLPVLCEYCLPFVKKGGVFVAMKGASAAEEAAAAGNALRLLGGGKPHLVTETLTGEEQRAFILVKKISQTPPKYPRSGGKIAKSAL